MSEKEQAVVEEIEAKVKPSTEATDAPEDDLDKLLAQYDQETKGSKSEPEQKSGDGQYVSKAEWEAYQQREREERVNREIDMLADQIKGDSSVSRRMVRGWLEEFTKSDPVKGEAMANAYFQPKSPADKNKVIKFLTHEFQKEYGTTAEVDKTVTEDVEAVAHHVRGTSGKAPEQKAPDMSRLSNQEFRQEVLSKYGYDPGV